MKISRCNEEHSEYLTLMDNLGRGTAVNIFSFYYRVESKHIIKFILNFTVNESL